MPEFRAISFRFFTFIVIAMLGAAAGCGSSSITVTLAPIHARQKLSVNFSRAYFGRDQAGEDQIVLVSDPIDSAANVGVDTQHPATAPPLWQVLAIRLHWRKATYSGLDSPVSSNAVMHWYVYTKPGDPNAGVLDYVGTGAVAASPNATGATITIGNAELTLQSQHGSLKDPFQSFHLSDSSFHAESDSAKLQQTMDDVNKALAP